MSEIKERPVLFSSPMVRAILEGRKTVTRRVMANQLNVGWRLHPEFPLSTINSAHPKKGRFGALIRRELSPGSGKFEHDLIPSPYGQPGDRLWVRESFSGPWCMEATEGCAAVPPSKWGQSSRIWYWADGEPTHGDWTRPRPSIHMPRWASRILLEITAVRVERLQEGEGETAYESRYVAEGINEIHHGDGEYYYHAFQSEPGPGNWCDPFDAWRELWVSVNGAESWNANPWVWVVEFKRVTP